MRLSLRHSARITSTTLFPRSSEPREWTEVAAIRLVSVGAIYFTIHFVVAAARGLLS